jgi:hypothetical protein
MRIDAPTTSTEHKQKIIWHVIAYAHTDLFLSISLLISTRAASFLQGQTLAPPPCPPSWRSPAQEEKKIVRMNATPSNPPVF